MKVYIIYFEWKNTAGNHAGMAYLARQLNDNISSVRVIKMISSKYKYLRVINFVYSIFLSIYFRIILKKEDKVLLMEYMARGSFQNFLAFFAHKLNSSYTTIGLVHLSGSHLQEIYKSNDRIIKKLSYVNKIMVFGSSLESFLVELGFDNVIRTFHYVDTDYYKPHKEYMKPVLSKQYLNIVCIGNIKRDFMSLQNLVLQCPQHKFHICQGVKDLSNYYERCTNVILYNFLSEEKLLSLMQKCDIGLSMMDETVGSNVITTSLASGLVQLVSDVGSIRDYCTINDTFFCKTEDDFITALNTLSNDRNLVIKMKRNAKERSAAFSLTKFLSFFNNTFIITNE